jgi:hypothetical protein
MLAMRCARGKPFKHRGYLEVLPAALGVTVWYYGHCGKTYTHCCSSGLKSRLYLPGRDYMPSRAP